LKERLLSKNQLKMKDEVLHVLSEYTKGIMLFNSNTLLYRFNEMLVEKGYKPCVVAVEVQVLVNSLPVSVKLFDQREEMIPLEHIMSR
jgi:hypothetical protein